MQHPGPQPPLHTFPATEASAVLTAIETLLSRLGSLKELVNDGAGALGSFRGDARGQFDSAVDYGLGEIDWVKTHLETQRDALEGQIQHAETQIEIRNQERVEWEQQRQAWNEWVQMHDGNPPQYS